MPLTVRSSRKSMLRTSPPTTTTTSSMRLTRRSYNTNSPTNKSHRYWDYSKEGCSTATTITSTTTTTMLSLSPVFTSLHTNPSYVLTAILWLSSFGTSLERRTVIGKALSAPLATMALALIVANVGIIPFQSPINGMVNRFLVPLAVPLLLFDSDLNRVVRDTGTLLAAFGVGAIATMVGTIVAFPFIPLTSLGPDVGWRVACALAARHIGGAINFVAVAETLHISGNAVAAAIAADNIVVALYFAFLFSIAKPGEDNIISDTKTTTTTTTTTTTLEDELSPTTTGTIAELKVEQNKATSSITLSTLAISLSIASSLVTAGSLLTKSILPSGTSSLPLISTLTVLAATAFPKFFNSLSETGTALGVILVQLFFACSGAAGSIRMVFEQAPALFAFSALQIGVHFGTLLTIGRGIFRLPHRELYLASNANVGGPTTAAAMAQAKEWKRLVLPALLIGILGYATATPLALSLGPLLLRLPALLNTNYQLTVIDCEIPVRRRPSPSLERPSVVTFVNDIAHCCATHHLDVCIMDIIESLSGRCRVATPSNTVLHSECAYTFYNPFSNEHDGILVNMNTFIGTVPELAFHGSSSSSSMENDIFLRVVKTRVERQQLNESDNATTTTTTTQLPTKLAIGVEGGFSTEDDKYQVITKHSIVVLKNDSKQTILAEVPLDDDTKSQLPQAVVKSAESIIHHVGLAVQQDLTAWQDDEEIPVSKYYQNLPFIDNGVQISPDPKSWKCEKSGATENLWLNLSDGFIGGGRKNWDGSGGSNGALDHFVETGEKYPLVVKLGTITTEGSTVHADCYSYAKDEDGPVKIPNLAELLAKRGIQVTGLQKTEKSTAELEVELNATYAFDAITESGSKLVSVTGPGLQGLVNLGNSCYCNSVVQVLSAVPEIANRYGSPPNGNVKQHKLFHDITPSAAPNDLLVQTSKLVSALTSGAYAIPHEELEKEGTADPKYRVAPRMFKHLIGKDHVDFRTGQQQDAEQFLQYMLEQLDRAEAKYDRNMLPSSHVFSFQTEARMLCTADQKIKYKDNAPEVIWSLALPMEKAVVTPVLEEPEQKKQKQEEDGDENQVPTLTFQQCVDSWAEETLLDDYRWPHLNDSVHPGMTKTRFKSFPRYLWLQVRRYKIGPDWQPVKIEVNLDIPESIDLSDYKATGPQQGEDLVPDEPQGGVAGPSGSTAQPEISEMALCQLMDMGFGMNGCKRALLAVGGSDTEAAMNWIFEHNMDPDFDDPLPESGAAAPAPASGDGVDDAVASSLVESLGCFTFDQVRAALKETNGAADRAADWLFSHMDDLDGAIANLQATSGDEAGSGTSSPGPKIPLEDGDGKYTMIGMISHIGRNTGSGHYVAHIKKDGKWVIFNDEKVALSEHPPIQHAYLYCFQRTDTIGSPNPNY
ncbi:DUF819 domain containing protein [Nitzschia inconspicua]|uniref:Ubiquitin carboxyl-terminal hydrolase 14 n=1 Tax=Nitzschia inconspicua TaxID=303405 RepID=A0A9K3PRG8_9STRA|nr:DUF819 domain containing protein [Nitzschia inconspicua]